MADLTYQIEVALGGTLTDVSTDVQGFTCSGGRQKQFESFQAGTCSFTIHDDTGDYIPSGGGTWSSETWIGREVKITVSAGGMSNVLWRGHVDDIDVDFVDRWHAKIQVSAVDPFALLGRTTIDAGTAFSSELSSTRIGNVLALPEVDGGYFTSATKDITAGETTLQAESDAGGSTLQYLQLVEASEGGRLFIRHGGDTGGVLSFRPRTGTSSDVGLTFIDSEPASAVGLIDGGTAETATFDATYDGGDAASTMADALDGGDATNRAEIRLRTVDIAFGSDVLVNRVAYTRDGGTQQIANNTGSQDRYGIRAASKTGLLNNTDADVLDLAELRVARVGSPRIDIEQLSVRLTSLTDDEAVRVSELTVGDQIKVNVAPPARPDDTFGATVRIEQVKHSAVPGRHDVTYRLTTLQDEFAGFVDGGNAETVSFTTTYDGGDAAAGAPVQTLDGGTANFV